jgi:hypothetical protein
MFFFISHVTENIPTPFFLLTLTANNQQAQKLHKATRPSLIQAPSKASKEKKGDKNL